jgi:hypothetical protein
MRRRLPLGNNTSIAALQESEKGDYCQRDSLPAEPKRRIDPPVKTLLDKNRHSDDTDAEYVKENRKQQPSAGGIRSLPHVSDMGPSHTNKVGQANAHAPVFFYMHTTSLLWKPSNNQIPRIVKGNAVVWTAFACPGAGDRRMPIRIEPGIGPIHRIAGVVGWPRIRVYL